LAAPLLALPFPCDQWPHLYQRGVHQSRSRPAVGPDHLPH